MCGLTTGNLSVYARPDRNKVIYSGELIDDSIEPNKSFLKQRFDFLATKKGLTTPRETLTTNPVVPSTEKLLTKKSKASEFKKPVHVSEKKHEVKQPAAGSGSLYEISMEQKRADLEKTEQEIEILKKKNEKLDGEYFPTEIAKAIVTQLGRSFTQEYKDLTENFLIEIAKKKDLSDIEMAEFRSFLLESINKSTTKAVADAKREMKNTLKVFTVKKEVGERE